MANDDGPTPPGRAADVNLYEIGADIPGGKAVLLVAEVDAADDVFVGQWTDEDTVSRIFDGDLYIRLSRSTPAFPALVDAELILAHDGQLLPITRVQNSTDWARELRPTAAAVTTLHADLEVKLECRTHAQAVAAPD
ncbi:hypothetical protein GCM10009839_88970 [Catenulispora yoronensis]|uniref:Uncharacterized protein n=1 Tax=Catenulispora yoronensis TaxID=450799 RepID=A0ABP5H342_9ACTN